VKGRAVLRRIVAKPRSLITTLLEAAGFGLISYGISLVSPAAGFIAAGVSLILIGVFEA
jgi:hypothetical protein